MKYAFLLFLFSIIALIASVRLGEPPENPFRDGHLVNAPVPPAIERVPDAPVPPPVLENLRPPTWTPPLVAAKIEILDSYQPGSLMMETQQSDASDWGLAAPGLAAAERAIASLIPSIVAPQPVTPVSVDSGPLTLPSNLETSVEVAVVTGPDPLPPPSEPVSPAPEDAEIAPNLYLPEGARNEAGARLTLIRSELKLYDNPDTETGKEVTTMKAGDQVRPLTRLKNAADYDWVKVRFENYTGWAQAEYFIRVDPGNRVASGTNIEIGVEQVDRHSALSPEYTPSDLAEVPQKYTFGVKNVKLRKTVVSALVKMATDAEKDGLKLRVFSGYRDFDHQKKLYLEAIQKSGPKQNGTAAPGYSEHQLGTTIDISSNDRRTILSNKFGQTPEGEWLALNARKYGFRNSYTTENTEEVGYKPEPWHLRYMGELIEDKPAETVAEKR